VKILKVKIGFSPLSQVKAADAKNPVNNHAKHRGCWAIDDAEGDN